MIAARFEGRLGDFRLDVALETPSAGVTVTCGSYPRSRSNLSTSSGYPVENSKYALPS